MKFTIRDLLWLTVVVALGTAWWEQSRNCDAMRIRAGVELKRIETEYSQLIQRYAAVEHELLKRDVHVVRFSNGKVAVSDPRAAHVLTPSAPAQNLPSE